MSARVRITPYSTSTQPGFHSEKARGGEGKGREGKGREVGERVQSLSERASARERAREEVGETKKEEEEEEEEEREHRRLNGRSARPPARALPRHSKWAFRGPSPFALPLSLYPAHHC